MKKRGRKSAAELLVVSPLTTVRRPEPPYTLTDLEADLWRSIVAAMPADWFPRETHELLAFYCRHVINGDRLGQLVHAELHAGAKGSEINVDYWDQLLRMQERESRAASALAVRLRLTTQANRSASAKKGSAGNEKRPWET